MPHKNKEEGRAYYADWYAKNREKKISQVVENRRRTAEHRNKVERDRHHRYRQIVFDHYGNVCECCGETEKMFLTVDHINGGGVKHARKVGSLYFWLVTHSFPDGFRLLCMNCNFGRHRNGGVCPHQRE